MSVPTVLVTGGIGSGKSLLCSMLSQRGIPVYDCDGSVRRLYDSHPGLLDRVEELVGEPLRLGDGSLDRRRLSARIFSSDSLREAVEDLVYPVLKADIIHWNSLQGEELPFVVLESAIMMEKSVFDSLYEASVLVDAPEDLRVQRAALRDGTGEEAVRERIAAQHPLKEKADAVILNDGTPQQLRSRMESLFFDKNSYICKLIKERI